MAVDLYHEPAGACWDGRGHVPVVSDDSNTGQFDGYPFGDDHVNVVEQGVGTDRDLLRGGLRLAQVDDRIAQQGNRGDLILEWLRPGSA
jgi:hypothetical protein